MPDVRAPFRWLKPFIFPLFTLPRPEPSSSQLYARHLSGTDVVVEIGANKGGGTLLLSMLVRWVYSFEPDKRNFRQVSTIAKMCPNVTAFNLGCGSENRSNVGLKVNATRARSVL